MSDNSLESVLQWMADPANNVFWDWDCIAAMNRDKTNRLLAQVYIARFNSSSYLPPISGTIPLIENSYEQHIHDFILDTPLLSFENASLDNSKAKLTMAVSGGVQVSMKKLVDVWQATAIHDIDPLQGPKLYLNLQLDKVPGLVGQDGEIKLDLKDSDDFVLTFADTEEHRRLGGDFFKQLFRTLHDDLRVFVLGSIEPGGQPSLRPQGFKLRTLNKNAQSRQVLSADPGDGAILALICLAGGTEGAIPGNSFRYPIADDADKDYSATVLLQRERTVKLMSLVEAVLERAKALFPGAQFNTVTGPNGKLQSAVATAGRIRFDSVMQGAGPFGAANANVLYLRLFFSGMDIQANSKVPFSIRLQTQPLGVKVNWQWEGSCTRLVDMIPSRSPTYERQTVVRQYRINLDVFYEVVGQGADLVLMPQDFVVDESFTESDTTVTTPKDIEIDEGNPLPLWQMAAQLASFVATYGSPALKPSIKAQLERQFDLASSVGRFITESIKLNFSQAIVTDELHIPRDIGAFGRINPTSTAFVIDPITPRVLAGGRRKFSVWPEVSGLSWKLENLDPERAKSAGRIETDGTYRAPPADAFSGRFLRVRVTASKGENRSSALISVLRHGLTINPLIQICEVGGQVELAQGNVGLGEGIWKIHNPVEGESGRLVLSEQPDHDRTYIAISETEAPEGKTYVLDRIDVMNLTIAQSTSAYVLVQLVRALLTVVPVDNPSLPEGQMQFQALFQGNPSTDPEWYLPLEGPGCISAEGIYTSDPDATERFVLIMVKKQRAIGLLEGHMILPLPLAQFPDELNMLRHSGATN